MWARRAADGLEVFCPAKLNLFLEVLGKRSDGYHELETLMAPVDLYDSLFLEDDPTGAITLSCETSVDQRRADPPPTGFDNLTVRAAALLRERTGIARGVRMRLVKRIPMAAGLAGGSTDAAAALWGANRVWGLGLAAAELGELAAELGSDAPFFLAGGPAVCRGRGERVEPTCAGGPWHFVVATPRERLSTARVFKHCRPADRPREVEEVVEAFARGRIDRLGRSLHNRLQAAAEELEPAVGRLRREFDRLEWIGHQMSGSGSSWFGLCRNAAQARRAARILRARLQATVHAVRTTL